MRRVSKIDKKIYVVGLGPGNLEDISIKAYNVLKNVDVIAGYFVYTDLIKEEFAHKEIYSSGMKKEIERCMETIEIYKSGKSIALISSGDAGIYGMAGPMLEAIGDENIPVEIVPGITSAHAGGAIVGAPIMHDSALISLSDLLTPWNAIEKRVHCAADGDFVISIYNPKSRGRDWQIGEVQSIVSRYRDGKTPVAILKNIGRDGESSMVTTLDDFLNHEIDMFSMIIIGNSKTYINKNGKMITPRGYDI